MIGQWTFYFLVSREEEEACYPSESQEGGQGGVQKDGGRSRGHVCR